MSAFSFFQSAYLWALFALALPVAIHLLNRRRRRPLDFSTLRFFKASAVTASKTRRLRRIALLCVRLLLLAALAAIFAKPYDKRSLFSALTNPGGSVYCWVDPTKSMEYKEGADNAWEKAMALTASLEKTLPPSVQRYWYDEAQRTFVRKKAFTNDRIVSPRHGPAGIGAMMRAFASQAGASSRIPALVVVSDFQENICAALDSFFLTDSAKFPIIGVSVAPSKPWNFTVQKAFVPRERPLTVVSGIAALGKNCADAGVSVIAAGMRAGHDVVSVKNGAFALVPIAMPVGRELGAGWVQLDMEDPFMLDNRRYFVIGASSSLRVLIVGDTLKSFPLFAAFGSVENSPWRPIVLRRPQALTFDDIDSADLIVLNEVGVMTPPLKALCTDRSSGNKAIIVSPAIDPGATSFTTDLLRTLDARDRTSFFSSDKPLFPVLYDTVSWVWKGFPRLKETGAALYRYAWPLPGSALLGIDNHKPLATSLVDAAGRSWVFFAAPVGITESNNLCRTGMFVPLLDRIARFALELVDHEVEEWVAGLPRRNPFLRSRSAAIVEDAQNKRIAQWDNQAQVAFNEPGLYKIRPRGAPSYWVAVNADSQEIALRYGTPGARKGRKGPIRLLDRAEFLRNATIKKDFVFSYGLWCFFALLLFAELLLWERPDGDTTLNERERAS